MNIVPDSTSFPICSFISCDIVNTLTIYSVIILFILHQLTNKVITYEGNKLIILNLFYITYLIKFQKKKKKRGILNELEISA